jgi:hypothetical protein
VSHRSRSIAVLLGVSLLSGCAVGSTDVGTTASSQMQAAVTAIADSAAGGDYPAAVSKLDGLQSRLDQALADSQVGSSRGAQIQAAIDQVRADLTALVEPAAPSAASPSPTAVAPVPGPGSGAASSGNAKHKGKGKG